MKRSSSSTLFLLLLTALLLLFETSIVAPAAATATVATTNESSSLLVDNRNDDNDDDNDGSNHHIDDDQPAIQPSPDLTPEELQLLAEMNEAIKYPSTDQENIPLYKSLYDLLEDTQKEWAQWRTLQQEEIPNLVERHRAWTERQEEAKKETVELLDLIRLRNQNEIRSVTMRLYNVLLEELDRRERLPELESQYYREMMMKTQEEEEGSDRVTVDDIHQVLNVPDLTRLISETLGSNVLNALNEKMGYALGEYLGECQDMLERKQLALQQDILEAKRQDHQEEANQCVKVVDAANQIIASLMQLEKDEKQTDALVDAKIIHGEKWTSDTFQPKAQVVSSFDHHEELKLGDLQIRKYIPQDWERWLLPLGWKDWDISFWQKLKLQSSSASPQNMLPAYFWHSIPRQWVTVVESSFQKAIPAPVETIMDPNGHLGSCWKMAGRNGRVTFRLARPVMVESITIDHYPWLSSAHNPEEYWNHVASAPRFMRVIGYPPCEEEDVECQEQIGFDAEHAIYMNSFEYKIDALQLEDGEVEDGNNINNVSSINSSQTFPLSPVHLLPDDDDDDDAAAKENMATCDAIDATCRGEENQTNNENSSKLIAALTLTIDVNWGHPNYTCLYRVRVNERQ